MKNTPLGQGEHMEKGCEFHGIPPTGSFARQNLIYAQYVVISLNTPQGFYMHRKDYQSYQIQLTTAGHGRLIYDGVEYDLKPGDCYFIDCRREHTFYTAGKQDWVHHGLQINGHQLPAYFEQFYGAGSAKITPAHPDILDRLYRGIAEVCRSPLSAADLQINRLLTELLTELLLTGCPQSPAQLTGKIGAVCAYIDENFTQIRCIDDLADTFFMSKYHLCREFKRQTGKTIMEYISGLRLGAAKIMLSTTDIPVSDIALAAGYGSDNYFYPVFKDSEGMTPLQYRRLWQGGVANGSNNNATDR